MVALPLPPPARPLAFAVAAVAVATGIAAGIASTGCARPPDPIITAEEFDRDRLARADLVAAIAADHEALAAMIATERFETPGAIYTDPELRRLAKRLVDETRALDGLAKTDVLAPGAP